MNAVLFSEAWAEALGEALRNSQSYRRAAQDWEGAVVLDWNDAPSAALALHGGTSAACGVFLDLQHGDCRVARMATHADYASARFVLSADLEAWTTLLAGRISPTMALMRGKLKVQNGSIGALLPHAHAASELVREIGRAHV